MPELVHRKPDTPIEELCEIVARDGAMILDGVLDAERVGRALDEITPFVDATPPGRDAFVGRNTRRTGALVARSPACREMIMQPAVLGAARKFLEPWCDRIQLHLSQVIRIGSGQPTQQIHRDRWAWGTHLDKLEPQFNTIWALSPFTRENGATRVVPGSVDWPDARQPKPDEIGYAEMEAGSVLLYSGAVFHGGGENQTGSDRVGVNLTYTLGWLRQEENQYLSCPPEIARTLDPELQDLIGYARGSYALGYYTPPLPPGEGPELVGPEYAVGRGDPAKGFGESALLESLTTEIAERGAPERERV